MPDVKFLDLQTQYQAIKPEITAAIMEVLDSSAYVLGPKVAAFEEAFAAAHDAKHGIAVNSGTSALHLALLALGIGPGDEVITVSMTFTATVAAISYTGAVPVFVDCDPVSYTMDPAQIETKITSRTKAIIPVHLYGQSADMDPIMEIAERCGIKVIEDAAQAHLARYNDRPVGGIGTMGCFSFYPGKNLGAYGEGGLITTNDDALADKMRLLRDWGQVRKYHHEMLAYNYRMDGIQGAVLGVKLPHLDRWTEQRRSHAARYRELLAGTGLTLTKEMPGRRHVYHIFSVFHPERDRLRDYLTANGIQNGLHYPFPVHLQKAYAELGHKEADFPVTEKVANQQLSLPMYPEMPEADIERVAAVLRNFV